MAPIRFVLVLLLATLSTPPAGAAPSATAVAAGSTVKPESETRAVTIARDGVVAALPEKLTRGLSTRAVRGCRREPAASSAAQPLPAARISHYRGNIVVETVTALRVRCTFAQAQLAVALNGRIVDRSAAMGIPGEPPLAISGMQHLPGKPATKTIYGDRR